jgi:hypothetical protein
MHDLLGCGKNIYELNEDSKPQLNVHFKEKNEMKFFLSLSYYWILELALMFLSTFIEL